jgi:sugar fermentation stimulation protein A
VDSYITNLGYLEYCTIIKRLNRFTVLTKIGEKEEKVWLTNTGRLNEIVFENNIGLCLKIEKPKKLRYVLVGTKVTDDEFCLIDTRLQMECFEIAHQKNLIAWLKDFKLIKRNIRVNNSLIDYLFKKDNDELYLEVKSAVFFDGYYAMYPDCPSLRGRKHVEELISLNEKGKSTMLVFIAAHPLAKAFKPNHVADPILGKLIKEAYSKGVEVHSIKMSLKPNGDVILKDTDLPIEF